MSYVVIIKYNYAYFDFFFTGTSQSSTHYRYPVLQEVRWGADFQSVITRKLINETHGNLDFDYTFR